ncbi:hypothetical protein AVEN_148855-1 [Araneus ventricosus]|uniref:Uncharacterized protein n=1 Tax=Araneus ventricosus TaxID=182803 RepID=A0A4Y2F6H5_ARAVE|nr:hypothetical protein AVEN_80428-1 [Araneus ventricosus]GBM36188.1 hypothetical protein AVEN_148855-1 [Araneus ventricosus]
MAMVSFSAIHLRHWGFVVDLNPTSRTVPATHAQSTTARRNCTDVDSLPLMSECLPTFPRNVRRPRWPSGKVSALGPEGSKPDSIEDLSCIGPDAR